ncbi:MAG TPA: plastocyanin/azurin family copper-binding protein [Nitrososphaera sp.]|jgi:plastocyanin|nr:plastocyanin/azurin family copper-binding protein [Nitrososphaera sp.]
MAQPDSGKKQGGRPNPSAVVIAISIIVILATASMMQESLGGGAGRRSGTTVECDEGECEVSMTGSTFTPETLKVRPGATVAWTSEDTMPHTITSGTSKADMNSLFDSDILAPTSAGKRWEHRFDTKGTFDYFCKIHPAMAGRVVVAGEPIEDFSRQTFMMIMAAGVFGSFAAVATIKQKRK